MVSGLAQQKLGIEAVEVYLPATARPLAELVPNELPSTEELRPFWEGADIEIERLREFFLAQLGNGIHRCSAPAGTSQNGWMPDAMVRCAGEETASDMAVHAGRTLLAKHSIDKEQIGAVIFYHSTLSEQPAWSTACRLQYELGLKKATVLDMSQKGGNASFTALNAACTMLMAEPSMAKILLVGSDKFIPPYPRYISGLTFFHDSASAILVGRQPVLQVVDSQFREFPARWDWLMQDTDEQKFIVETAHEAIALLRELLWKCGCPGEEAALLLPRFGAHFRNQILQGLCWPGLNSPTQDHEGSLLSSDLAYSLSLAMAPGSGLKPKIALGAGLDHSLAAVLLHRVNGPTAPMRCESAKPVDVGIIGTSYYLPPEPLSVDQLSEQVGFADGKREFYRDIQGLETVYWGRGETPFQMAYKAAKNLLDTYQVDPLSIDALIIYHTFFVISLEPRTLIGELQEKLGLRRAIGFAASGQHCASFVGALRLGKDMITTGSANRVLLVGTDSFLGSLNREMEGMSLQSEGSSAALLEAGATKNRIAGLADHIDGSFFRGIAWDDRDKQRFNLIYCLCWKRLVEGLVKRLGLTMDDISLIVPHNINRPSWMQVLHHLRYPAHKFFDANIPRCGHVCSSDLVINLTDAAAQGRLRKDDYVLLLTAGMGAGWGAIALQH